MITFKFNSVKLNISRHDGIVNQNIHGTIGPSRVGAGLPTDLRRPGEGSGEGTGHHLYRGRPRNAAFSGANLG
jgi:hypothetical protein